MWRFDRRDEVSKFWRKEIFQCSSVLFYSNLQYFVVAWLITPVALLSKAHKEFPIALREENSGALVTSDRRERRSISFIPLSFFSFVHKPASNIENFKYDLLPTVRFDDDKIKIEIESAFFYFDHSQLRFISKTSCNIKEMEYIYVINRYIRNIISIMFSNYIILKFNIYIFSLKI